MELLGWLNNLDLLRRLLHDLRWRGILGLNRSVVSIVHFGRRNTDGKRRIGSLKC